MSDKNILTYKLQKDNTPTKKTLLHSSSENKIENNLVKEDDTNSSKKNLNAEKKKRKKKRKPSKAKKPRQNPMSIHSVIKRKKPRKNSTVLDVQINHQIEIDSLKGEIEELEDQLNITLNYKKQRRKVSWLKEIIGIKTEKLNKLKDRKKIKLVKFGNKTPTEINKSSKNVKKRNQCQYCLISLLPHNYEIHLNKNCPKRPRFFEKEVDANENNPNIIIENLSWTLLPKGKWLFDKISSHFKQLNKTKKWKNKIFDKDRLQKIQDILHPNKCFIGKEEFEGYIVYCFDWTKKVILECPIYGNATYIIKKGKYSWKEIAKASKWEARTTYSEQVTAINHSETWIERLEQNLR